MISKDPRRQEFDTPRAGKLRAGELEYILVQRMLKEPELRMEPLQRLSPNELPDAGVDPRPQPLSWLESAIAFATGIVLGAAIIFVYWALLS